MGGTLLGALGRPGACVPGEAPVPGFVLCATAGPAATTPANAIPSARVQIIVASPSKGWTSLRRWACIEFAWPVPLLPRLENATRGLFSGRERLLMPRPVGQTGRSPDEATQ